jgi:hypothetical protein
MSQPEVLADITYVLLEAVAETVFGRDVTKDGWS